MVRSRILTAISAFAILAIVAAPLLACPTCKDGLVQGDLAQQKMATGYFYSILFMMSMPFAILGTFGSVAYLSIRKARLAQQSPTNDVPTDRS
jgi:hypothetical protein